MPPVLSPDSPVHEPGAHGAEMEGVGEDATSFIRPVDIALEAPGARMLAVYPHLSEVLARTDEELERVAKLCGAQVIRHTWRLIEPRPAHGKRLQEAMTEDLSGYRKMGIPRGKALVAEVELLREIEPLDEASADRVNEDINRYYAAYDALCDDEELENYRGVILSAIDPEQFVTGVSALAPPNSPRQLRLPDVEPRLIWAA